MRCIAILLIGFSIFGIATSELRAASHGLIVSGVIRKPDNDQFDPNGVISGASVIVRGTNVNIISDPSNKMVSDQDGKYSVRFNADQIDLIEFSNNQFHGKVVGSLSELDGNMQINIRLARFNGPVTFPAMLGQIAAYEQLYFVRTGENGKESKESVRTAYTTLIRNMPGPDSPTGSELAKYFNALTDSQRAILKRRRRELFELFGISVPPQLQESTTTFVSTPCECNGQSRFHRR
jgi:hypothetical protein